MTQLEESVKSDYDKDISNYRNSMGYKQWIICHKWYEVDGTVFKVGDMHKNNSKHPVMNTNNWRPATKEEIKQHYIKHLKLVL